MIEVGRVCVKIAGRDAGKKCVIVEVLDSNMVLIDGETRRRKCNARHLEPLADVLKIKKSAEHEEVAKALGMTPKKKKEVKPKTEAPKKVTKRAPKAKSE